MTVLHPEPMTPLELKAAALSFRRIVEQIAPLEQRFASLKRFPAGCCKDTSFLMARVFDRCMGWKEMEYVYGMRDLETFDWYTHGWLEIGGYIVDVTADQFSEISDPVLVAQSRSSPFHASFERQSRFAYPQFWSFHEEAASDFERTFRMIAQDFDSSKRSCSA